MIQIKFRGMTLSGQWVYGLLAYSPKDRGRIKKGWYISNSEGVPFAYHVRPETIGQFSGLFDKNGNEIYEGATWNGYEVKFGSFYSYLENGLGDGYDIVGFHIINNEGIAEPVEDGGIVNV